MEENRIRTILAQKLAAYRKRAGMTQAELAQKLNYSDKSVSKWERGDGMPDLLVLCQLADLYDVPLDAFLREGPMVRSQKEQHGRHVIITLLSLGLVVFVSAIAFFVCYLANVRVGWLSFVYGAPVMAILLVVFSHIWGNPLHQAIAVSLLDWSLIASIYVSFRAIAPSISGIAMLFMVGAVFQVLIILWYVLMYFRRRNRARKGEGNVLS